MRRVTLYISGNVQAAGYRTKVAIAKAIGIKGTVAPDGRVKIIAEGEESDLEKLIQAINIKKCSYQTDIEKEYSSPTGEYDNFYKLVSEGETDERINTAANLLKELINVTKTGQDQTMAKIDQSREDILHDIAEIKAKIAALQ